MSPALIAYRMGMQKQWGKTLEDLSNIEIFLWCLSKHWISECSWSGKHVTHHSGQRIHSAKCSKMQSFDQGPHTFPLPTYISRWQAHQEV